MRGVVVALALLAGGAQAGTCSVAVEWAYPAYMIFSPWDAYTFDRANGSVGAQLGATFGVAAPVLNEGAYAWTFNNGTENLAMRSASITGDCADAPDEPPDTDPVVRMTVADAIAVCWQILAGWAAVFAIRSVARAVRQREE